MLSFPLMLSSGYHSLQRISSRVKSTFAVTYPQVDSFAYSLHVISIGCHLRRVTLHLQPVLALMFEVNVFVCYKGHTPPQVPRQLFNLKLHMLCKSSSGLLW